MNLSTEEVILAIVSNIPNPFPDVPITGIDGWRNNQEPRPCMESMRLGQRITHGRNNIIYALASELSRRKWGYDQILSECKRVNERAFLRSLGTNAVVATVKSAIKRKYAHHCEDETLQRFCIGPESCNWCKSTRRGSTEEVSDETLFDTNWFQLLRQPVRELYLHIVDLERRFKSRPGGTLTRSYRQITQDLRLRDKGTVIRSMRKLEELGLVLVSPPSVLRNLSDDCGFATRFRRVIPIPMPGNSKKGEFL